MNMRLIGARTVDEIVPEMVDASCIHSHIVAVPDDRLFVENCKCRAFDWPFPLFLLPFEGERRPISPTLLSCCDIGRTMSLRGWNR